MRRPRGRGWMRLSGSNRKKISSKGKREKEKKDSRVFSWTTGQIEGGHQGTRRTLFSSVGVQGLEARWHSRVICWTFNLFFYLKEASAGLSHKKPQSHPDTRTRWNGKSFLIRGQGMNFHPWLKGRRFLDSWPVLREYYGGNDGLVIFFFSFSKDMVERYCEMNTEYLFCWL